MALETPQPFPPALDRYLSHDQLRSLIATAKTEDLGTINRDITSECLIPPTQTAQAHLRTRQAGKLAGLALLPTITEVYNRDARHLPDVRLQPAARDGDTAPADQPIATFTGSLRTILAIERVALNFLTHLSGIATLTARFVEAVADTPAIICDTRKTLPGLRALEKYAAACGGGHNHRTGLYDAVLVKDNHIAHIALGDLPAALKQIAQAARSQAPPPRFIEIEVDSLEQLELILQHAREVIDIALLDNMPVEMLRRAVQARNRLAPRVLLEASGGVNLHNVKAIASTGIDRISIGAITHSAPALDIGLDIP
jgi:nicotinate-nucleotide pyrophosphorylase (carboxylating)